MTWINVKEALPDRKVLATYKNSSGMGRIVVAVFIKRHTEEVFPDDYSDPLNCEYCDDDDCHYIIEGWYECIDNWEMYSSIVINEGVVTHWMPLPELPVN